MTTDATTDDARVSWAECLGDAAWLQFPLEHNLRYPAPLPVQQAVIPTVARALLSGIPMDVSLTAPTGSGKTLCYLLPALRLITCEKKGVDSTALRAVILVPTKALGQQVFREIQRLTRNTSITAASLCDDVETVKEESWELMRYTTTLRAPGSSGNGAAPSVFENAWAEGGKVAEEEEDGSGAHGLMADGLVLNANARSQSVAFSKVDLLVATPQRLLRHLDGATPGFSLASLRLLIIDEADQVLAGSFASFVSKVVDRFEAEQDQRREAEAQALHASRAVTSLSAASSSAIATRLLSTTCATGVLHKILCSATLSSRIGRISEVRLRNCVHYALDSHGRDVDGGTNSALTTTPGRGFLKTTFALPPTLQEHIVFVADAYRHAALLKLVVQLVESIKKQHAARQLRERTRQRTHDSDGDDSDDAERAVATTSPKATTAASEAYPAANDQAGTGILVFCSSAEEARVIGHLLTAAGVSGVVEFTTLATESERRRALLGPLRAESGSDASRREKKTSFSPMCVVASDALMRGIDIPNVGHVVMYHPPTSVSQYVHRAGRTARAMRPGHLHLLLSKTGRSGTQQDGEMALFKVLGEQLTRTLPVKHERHFFYFDSAPQTKARVPAEAQEEEKNNEKETPKPATEAEAAAGATDVASSSPADSTAAEATPEKPEKKEKESPSMVDAVPVPTTDAAAEEVRAGSGEWWVQEADRYLRQSQHHLQRMWASALETALRDAKNARAAESSGTNNNNNDNKNNNSGNDNTAHKPHHSQHDSKAKADSGARRGAQANGRGQSAGGRHPFQKHHNGTPAKPQAGGHPHKRAGAGQKRSRS